MSEQRYNDPIGTIRFEGHASEDQGYSIWAKVGYGVYEEDLELVRIAGSWQCVYSSSPGNPGCTLPSDIIEQDNHPVVGFIPGTPAAQQERQA